MPSSAETAQGAVASRRWLSGNLCDLAVTRYSWHHLSTFFLGQRHANSFSGQTLLTPWALIPEMRPRLSPLPSWVAPDGHLTPSSQSEASGD